MSGLSEAASSFFPWLIQTSLQAGLLAVLVLAILACLGRRLEPRWQCLLWLVLAVRLALPWAPGSRFSVHNALAPVVAWTGIRTPDEAAREANAAGREDRVATASARAPTSGGPSRAWTEPMTAADSAWPIARVGGSAHAGLIAPLRPWLWPGIWLMGALVAAGCMFWNQFTLWRAVRGRRPITDGAVLDLLEDCKARMGVGVLLALVPTDRLHTPALYGLMRPRLLIPSALTRQLSREELSHVLLHELAHLKRLDIHFGWATAMLQIVHWFNPLVWLAFARWRTARELACDQRVLTVLSRGQSRRYGQTILHLLECWTPQRRLPGLVGILEERSQLRRRISMIANPQPKVAGWSATAVLLIAGLVCVGLTNAQTPKTPGTDKKDAAGARPAKASTETDAAAARSTASASDWKVLWQPTQATMPAPRTVHVGELGGLGQELENRDWQMVATKYHEIHFQPSADMKKVAGLYQLLDGVYVLLGGRSPAKLQTPIKAFLVPDEFGRSRCSMTMPAMRTGEKGDLPFLLTSFIHEETHLYNFAFLDGRHQNAWAGEYACIYFQERAGLEREGGDIKGQLGSRIPGGPTGRIDQLDGYNDQLFEQATAAMYFLEEKYGRTKMIEFRKRCLESAKATKGAKLPESVFKEVFGKDGATLDQEWCAFYGWSKTPPVAKTRSKPQDPRLNTKVRYASSNKKPPPIEDAVEYAVMEVASQAGLGYDFDKSLAQTKPLCMRWLRNVTIEGIPCHEALDQILKPVGLEYEIEDNKIVLCRKGASPRPTTQESHDPHLDAKVDFTADEASVQDIVGELAKQAGLQYNRQKSREQTDPTCRKWVHSVAIKGLPCHEALDQILEPVGLKYRLEDGSIVLYRK